MLKLFVSYMEEHEDEILDELMEYYFEEGKKEAIEETSLKLAKNFKDVLSDEEISKIMGVPLQKVQKL